MSESKGNQLKWEENNVWHKADYLGYESLAEEVVSQLLYKTNIPFLVDYRIEKATYGDKTFTCCQSQNFLPNSNTKIMTLNEIFQKYLEMDIAKECAHIEYTTDRIRFVVENVKKITNLEHFGEYLTLMLEMDSFFLNEDRHFNNIAVLYDSNTKQFSYCPFFDNGACLYSDTTISYPLEYTIEQCEQTIDAKPFSRDFEEQVDAANSLYKTWLNVSFSKKDVDLILNNIKEKYPKCYNEQIWNRVQTTLNYQIDKYQCYQKNKKQSYKDNITDLFKIDKNTCFINQMKQYVLNGGHVVGKLLTQEWTKDIISILEQNNIPYCIGPSYDNNKYLLVRDIDKDEFLAVQKEVFQQYQIVDMQQSITIENQNEINWEYNDEN